MFFQKNRWVAIGQSNIGKSHIESKIPCQDSTHFVCTKKGLYCALCDGLGSKPKSDIGSNYISKKIVDIIRKEFNFLYNYDDETLPEFIVNSLKENIINDLNIDVKDLDDYKTTLVFIAIKKGKYIIGSIGDSIVGLLNKGQPYYISTMNKTGSSSTYANTTFSIFDHDAAKKLKIKKGSIHGEFDSAFLISDGLPFLAHSNKVAPNLSKFIDTLNNNKFESISNLMNKTLKSIVDSKSSCVDDWSYVFVKKTTSDKQTESYYDSRRMKR